MRHISAMAAGLAFCALAGPLAALAQADGPSADAPFLVISPTSAADVLHAGGDLLEPFRSPLAVLATGGDDVIARLYASGAWLVLDGGWIVELCGVAAT